MTGVQTCALPICIRKNVRKQRFSNERHSKEKNEFRKNVIRSNDLVPFFFKAYFLNVDMVSFQLDLMLNPDSIFSETGATLSDANIPIEEPVGMDAEKMAKIKAKLKMMTFNKDVEQIKTLVIILPTIHPYLKDVFIKILALNVSVPFFPPIFRFSCIIPGDI